MTSCSDACSLITDHGQEPGHCKRNDAFFSQSTRADMPASQLGHLQCAQLAPAPGSVFGSDWEPSANPGAVIHHHLSLSLSFTIDRAHSSRRHRWSFDRCSAQFVNFNHDHPSQNRRKQERTSKRVHSHSVHFDCIGKQSSSSNFTVNMSQFNWPQKTESRL